MVISGDAAGPAAEVPFGPMLRRLLLLLADADTDSAPAPDDPPPPLPDTGRALGVPVGAGCSPLCNAPLFAAATIPAELARPPPALDDVKRRTTLGVPVTGCSPLLNAAAAAAWSPGLEEVGCLAAAALKKAAVALDVAAFPPEFEVIVRLVGVPGLGAALGEPAAPAVAADGLTGTPALGFAPCAAEGDAGSVPGRLEGLTGPAPPTATAAAAAEGSPVLRRFDGLAGWPADFSAGLSEGPRRGFRVDRGLFGPEAVSGASMGCADSFAVLGLPGGLLPAVAAGPVPTLDPLAEPGCLGAPSAPRGELAVEGTRVDFGI